ncbi:MAG: PIN domain-containing protein [Clostridia bacterium]
MIYIFDLENVSGKAFTGIENLGDNDKVVVFYSQNSKNISIDTHIKIIETPVEKEYIKVKIGGRNALDFQLATYIGCIFGQKPSEEIIIVSGDMGFDYVVDFWKDRQCVIRRKLYIDKPATTVSDVVDEETFEEIENQDSSENLTFFEIESDNVAYEIPLEIPNNLVEDASKYVELQVTESVGNENSEQPVDNIKEISKAQEKNSYKNEINTILCKKIGTKPTGEVYEMIEKYKTKQGINNALCKKLGSQTAGEVYKIIKPLIENKKGR